MKVSFHTEVYKELQRLPREVFRAALTEIVALADDPRPHGAVKLVGGGSDWRIRVGPYRIIYEINESDDAVVILRVAKRSDAYR